MVENKEIASVLNNLIETCKDGEEGFRQAAQGVESSDLRETFNELSAQRGAFATALQGEVSKLGDEPESSGSISGSLHRGWMNIKKAVTGKDDQAILNEAERGEDVAVKAYTDALNKELPADVQLLVNEQFQRVREAHDQVRSLRDTRRQLAGTRQ